MAAVVAMAKEEKVGGCAVLAATGNMVVTVAREVVELNMGRACGRALERGPWGSRDVGVVVQT
jgi:hypothetical protein